MDFDPINESTDGGEEVSLAPENDIEEQSGESSLTEIFELPEAAEIEEAERPAVGHEPASPVTEPDVSRPYEYVYNNYEPEPKKQSAVGKAAIIIITVVLSVFIVSIIAISAYANINGDPAFSNESGLIFSDDKTNKKNDKTNKKKDDIASDSDVDPDIGEDENAIADSDEAPEGDVSTPSNISDEPKNFPTLEQLAAPDDAMKLPDIYDKVSPSVVGVSCTVRGGTASGTGIMISEDGYIITNAHVVENAKSVMIVTSDFEEFKATIIGTDAQTDLAVLKISGEGFVPCEFGCSGNLRIGELAVVIGNPLGFDLYGTMTDGIISGLNRTITIGDNEMTLIQTSASINKGNSGGPLINAYGQVVGITSAKVDPSYGEGLGFAIPIDAAIPIFSDLIKYGYVTGRPMIGFSGENITAIMSLYYRLPEGVYVTFVTPDSGAEKAGIKGGDIIIAVNGETITTMEELNEIKNRFSAGDTITLTVFRDGVSRDIDVVLSEVTKNDEH